ncbi:MAG: zinc ribbon domain-containing protein [Deltaproteobacteria bacterium]|nr:zinc ribbon domain-containing protein [Deltaproteobacteria bacterium]
MPLYDLRCRQCGHSGEVLTLSPEDTPACPACGSRDTVKEPSRPSSLTGRTGMSHPGPGDHGCCGQSPAAASCAGPGSCCGKGPF